MARQTSIDVGAAAESLITARLRRRASLSAPYRICSALLAACLSRASRVAERSVAFRHLRLVALLAVLCCAVLRTPLPASTPIMLSWFPNQPLCRIQTRGRRQTNATVTLAVYHYFFPTLIRTSRREWGHPDRVLAGRSPRLYARTPTVQHRRDRRRMCITDATVAIRRPHARNGAAQYDLRHALIPSADAIARYGQLRARIHVSGRAERD